MREDFTGQGILEDAYSYERPAYILGNAILNGIIQAGFTKKQAINLFYSKAYRWALDFDLGEQLDQIGYQEGQKMAQEYEASEFDYPLPENIKIALLNHNHVEEI